MIFPDSVINLLEKVRREEWRLYDQQGCAIFLHLTWRLRQDKHKAKEENKVIGHEELVERHLPVPWSQFPSLFVVLWRNWLGTRRSAQACAPCRSRMDEAVTRYEACALGEFNPPMWEWAGNGDYRCSIWRERWSQVNCTAFIDIMWLARFSQSERVLICWDKVFGRQNVANRSKRWTAAQGLKEPHKLSAFFLPSSPSTYLTSFLYSCHIRKFHYGWLYDR